VELFLDCFSNNSVVEMMIQTFQQQDELPTSVSALIDMHVCTGLKSVGK